MGISMLNESETIERGGARIHLAGIDDAQRLASPGHQWPSSRSGINDSGIWSRPMARLLGGILDLPGYAQ